MTWADGLKDALWQWAVPLLVLVVGLSEAFANSTSANRIFEICIVLALALPLVIRTRAPIVAFAVIMVAAALQATFSDAQQDAIPLAVVVASAAVGRYALEPVSWIAPLSLLLITVGFVLFGQEESELILGGIALAGVWFLGRSFRLRADLVAAQEERAALLVKQSEEREAQAIERERARIARELHDIVGHATSLITIRLQALRRRLPAGDPTAEEIRGIEHDARQALSDMRRLVAVMRETDLDENRLQPPPTLNDLPALIDSVRRAGFAVQAEIDEPFGSLDPGIQLAAYRVVQEALTNALRHSKGSQVRVLVSRDRGSIHIDVEDNGKPSLTERNGSGLLGMRERVGLYGGSVSAGPAVDGGYRVQASMPISEGSQ